MENKPYIPINLKKLSRYELLMSLKIGDTYNFLLSEPLMAEHQTIEYRVVPLQKGDFFIRHYPNEDATRAFQITEITQTQEGWFYETIFRGYQKTEEIRGITYSSITV